MKKINFFSLAFLVMLQVVFVYSQNDTEVVKITTNLIQIDAVVTDKNGKIVIDLKPEDFEIYENGERRQISGFSFVSAAPAGAGSVNTIQLLSAANSSFAALAGGQNTRQVGRITAIVFDDLTLSHSGLENGKKNIARFIERELAPGDLMAIIKTSGSVGILQKFTNDKKQLLSALESLLVKPLTSVGGSRNVPMSISFSEQVAGSLIPVGEGEDSVSLTQETASIIAGRSSVEALSETLRSETNALGALQVLKQTIDALGYLKGRKTLIFVSEGTSIGYNANNQNAVNAAFGEALTVASRNAVRIGDRSYTTNNFLRAITEAANRNSVSIFPVDPSGAVAVNLSAEDATRGGMFDSKTAAQVDAQVVGRGDDIRAAQENLKFLARETGGKAVINRNDFDSELKEIFDSQAGYYVLAYEPDDETFDPRNNRFNNLEIKVKRPNVNVSYRSGFFNVAGNIINQKAANENAAAGREILQKLLAPYNFSDIGVEIASVYAGTQANSSTVRSFINILPGSLTQTDEAGGKKNVKFDLFVAVFNEDGAPGGSTARNFTISLDAASQAAFLKSGIASNLAFAVPKPGVYRVKALVKDNHSGKIGTASQIILVPAPGKQPISFSGLLLQNFSQREWQESQKNPAAASANSAREIQQDTAFRRYKKGSVLAYFYNLILAPATLAKNGDSKVTLTMRLLKNNQSVFSPAPEEIPISAAVAPQSLTRRSAFNLGTEMQPGKYTLQITATTDKTRMTETQSIDFEIVE